MVSGTFCPLGTFATYFAQPREQRGSMSSPLRLLDTAKDGTRWDCAALRKAWSGTKRGNNNRAVPVSSRLKATSGGPLPSVHTDPPVPESRAGRQTGPGRPDRYPRGRAAPAPPRGGETRTRTRTRSRARERARERAHSLDVLPNGGAVVADDEQLQGVIDEAVLRAGRGGGAVRHPAGEPLPQPRSITSPASHPSHPGAGHPGKTRPLRNAPPSSTSPQSEGLGLGSPHGSLFPKRIQPLPSHHGPGQTRPGQASPSAPLSRVAKAAGRSSPWCRRRRPTAKAAEQISPDRLTASPGRHRPEWHPPTTNGERGRCSSTQWRERPACSPPIRGGGGTAGG